MTLRNATFDDVSEIAETEKSSFSIPLNEKELYDIIQNPLYRIITADENGRYVGHAVFYITDGVAEVVSVAVKDGERRKGYGKTLMSEVIKSAESVLLEVRASNRAAIDLYKSLGFEKIAVRPHFYEKPDEDAHTMKYESEKHK